MELFRSHSLPLFLIISLAFLHNSLSFAQSNDLISDVCSKTEDPAFCITALKSDPRSASADLKGLGQISIDLSTTSAKSTQTLVASLKKSATKPRLKGIYDTCTENYSDTVDDLGECTNLLNTKDYLGLNLRASAALDGPDTCDNGFEDAGITEPTSLSDASKKVQDLCGIILAISIRLQGNV